MPDPSIAAPVNYRRRSVFFASTILGLATGLSWALIGARSAPLRLGKPEKLEAWPFSFRLPEGWAVEEIVRDNRPWNEQAVAAGRIGGRADARLVFEYANEPGLGNYLGAVVRYRQTFMRDTGRIPGVELDESDVGRVVLPDRSTLQRTSIGTLAGVRLASEFFTPTGPRSLLVAAVGLPTGRIALVALECDARLGPMHERTFDSVCGGIELTDWPLAEASVAAAPAKTGLELELPSYLRVADAPSVFRSAVELVTTQDAPAAATLRVWPALLVPPRTPEDLVADFVTHATLRAEPAERPQSARIGDRSVVWLTASGGEYFELIGACDAGDGRALMLGIGGLQGEAVALREMAELVMRGARVTSAVDFDGDAAGRLATERVAALRSAGLDARWGSAVRRDWYLVERYGETIGYQVEERQPVETSDADAPPYAAWTGAAVIEWRSSLGGRRIQGRWYADRAVNAFEASTDTRDRGAAGRELRTRAARAAGADRITLEVGGEKNRRQRECPVGDRFVPDPLLDDLLADAAALDRGQALLIQLVDLRARPPFWRRVWPADTEFAPRGRAVFVQNDYDAERALYIFDADGRLERLMFEEGAWLQRSTRADVRAAVPWAKVGP